MNWKLTNRYKDARSGRVVERMECSVCGFIWHRGLGIPLYKFCPNCGTYMVAEQTEPSKELAKDRGIDWGRLP